MERARLALAALTVSSLTLAAACAPKTPTYAFKYAEKRAKLDNGLRLVVIPDENTPMVHVATRYMVGSNEDPPGKAGLAHLVEHMMFQHHLLGPDKPPTFQLLPQIATFFNAFTNFESTHYFLEARKEDLDGLLRLEAARMSFGCKTIPDAQFEREREVVRNEIRQRGGTPEGLIDGILLSAVYPKGHAYRQTTGGTDKQLASITKDDVCKFMKDYYVPSRATVVVVGNVDVDEVGKKVDEYFGGIKDRTPAPLKKIDPIPEFKHKVITKELDTERSQLYILWKIPSYFGEEGTKARLMTASLCGRVASFNRDWDFASDIGCGVYPTKLAPFLELVVELYDDGDKDDALDFVWKALDDVHRGFREGAFNKETKARAKASLIQSLEPLSARALQVAELVQFKKDFDFTSAKEYIIQELQQIDDLDGGEFRDFMKGRLKKSNSLVVYIKKSKKGLKGDTRAKLSFSATGQDQWDANPVINPAEAKRPLKVPQTKSILNSAERYTLGNGMDVILLPFDGWPVVTTFLMFRAGSADEPPDMAGLAQVAANFLFPPRDSDIGKTGVSFGSLANQDTTAFYGRGMEIYLGVVLKGLERLIKVGEHDQKAIEQWQKSMRNRFDSERFRVNQEFRQALAAAIYGPKHPYAVTGSPTRETVGKIGRDAAMDFKSKHYTAANGTLVLVGSFDALQAKEIIKENFGDWDKGHEDQPVAPTPRKRSGPEYFGVVDPEPTPQVQLALAFPSPAGIDGQQAARLILAEMLNLRMEKVRTELGSTYGTYARRRTQLGPSAYVIGGGIDETRAGESLKFIREQIDKLRAGEDFDLEFARARRIVLKQLLAESTETLTLAQRLAQIATYGLGLDYYDQLTRFVAAASPAQIKALIQQELRPETEIIGAMGNRDMLVKMFDEAGIENVRYIEPD